MRKTFKISTTRLCILILLLFTGIAYAYLTSGLNIHGSTSISNARWDIYLDNVQVTPGSVSGDKVSQPPVISNEKLAVSYHVHLDDPGDYYEFTVDAVNNGTINAMIESIHSVMDDQSLDNLPSYLTYSVTYANDQPVLVNQSLNKNTTRTFKVRIEFPIDADTRHLPTSDESINLVFEVNYKQADANVIP